MNWTHVLCSMFQNYITVATALVWGLLVSTFPQNVTEIVNSRYGFPSAMILTECDWNLPIRARNYFSGIMYLSFLNRKTLSNDAPFLRKRTDLAL